MQTSSQSVAESPFERATIWTLVGIMEQLDAMDLISMQRVCKRFYAVTKEHESVWKFAYERSIYAMRDDDMLLKDLCDEKLAARTKKSKKQEDWIDLSGTRIFWPFDQCTDDKGRIWHSDALQMSMKQRLIWKNLGKRTALNVFCARFASPHTSVVNYVEKRGELILTCADDGWLAISKQEQHAGGALVRVGGQHTNQRTVESCAWIDEGASLRAVGVGRAVDVIDVETNEMKRWHSNANSIARFVKVQGNLVAVSMEDLVHCFDARTESIEASVKMPMFASEGHVEIHGHDMCNHMMVASTTHGRVAAFDLRYLRERNDSSDAIWSFYDEKAKIYSLSCTPDRTVISGRLRDMEDTSHIFTGFLDTIDYSTLRDGVLDRRRVAAFEGGVTSHALQGALIAIGLRSGHGRLVDFESGEIVGRLVSYNPEQAMWGVSWDGDDLWCTSGRSQVQRFTTPSDFSPSMEVEECDTASEKTSVPQRLRNWLMGS